MSNTNVWHVEFIRNNFRILDLFDELIFSYEVGYIKPDKRIFERVLALCENSSDIIYVDDKVENVEAAKDVGLIGIEYSGPEMLLKELLKAGLL